MIRDRFIKEDDLFLLEMSLAKDEHHKGTEPEFFIQNNCVTKVYEDEHSPICFVRGTKALRLDIQFVDNDDWRRNAKVMVECFDDLVKKAREHGFTEIDFVTESPLLKKFCVRRLGFEEVSGSEMRRFIG